MIQVNAESFVYITDEVNLIWSSPLQVFIALIMLWSFLGPASIAGLASMILLIPVTIFLSVKIKNLQAEKLKYQDSRIKFTIFFLQK